MKKTGFVVAVLGCAAVAFAKGPQKAGNWRLTVQMEMAGMGQMPPQTFEKCITQSQADDPKQAIQAETKDCDPPDVKVSGNTVNYKITCHPRGNTATGTGQITYSGDSYSGTTTFEMANPRGGGTVKMIQHMSGQRIGDCK
ncbi:MAG TPA: DUF3617 domain-containing protein [Polyangia bacterium]|jgi:hypothetical protein